MTTRKPVGIEKINAYPCTLTLDMVALAEARGVSPAHPLEELWVESRSLNPVWEDPVTMAVNAARGYAQQITARAQGEAAQFERLYTQYRLAPDVTRRRMYYETMEQILQQTDTTVVEAPGVTPYLPLPQLQGRPPTPAPAPAQGGGR